jgi:hypothetical protein
LEYRLLAVAEYGIDALEGDEDGDDEGTEMVVHHENGHPLDNRPENLQLMEKKEHDDLHTSDNSEFIIENGEAKLVENPDDDARRAVEEWWDEADEITVEDVEADAEAHVGRQGV